MYIGKKYKFSTKTWLRNPINKIRRMKRWNWTFHIYYTLIRHIISEWEIGNMDSIEYFFTTLPIHTLMTDFRFFLYKVLYNLCKSSVDLSLSYIVCGSNSFTDGWARIIHRVLDKNEITSRYIYVYLSDIDLV